MTKRNVNSSSEPDKIPKEVLDILQNALEHDYADCHFIFKYGKIFSVKSEMNNDVKKAEAGRKRQWFSTKEIKDIYGIGRVILNSLVESGKIRRIELCGEFKYMASDLDDYFKNEHKRDVKKFKPLVPNR